MCWDFLSLEPMQVEIMERLYNEKMIFGTLTENGNYRK